MWVKIAVFDTIIRSLVGTISGCSLPAPAIHKWSIWVSLVFNDGFKLGISSIKPILQATCPLMHLVAFKFHFMQRIWQAVASRQAFSNLPSCNYRLGHYKIWLPHYSPQNWVKSEHALLYFVFLISGR